MCNFAAMKKRNLFFALLVGLFATSGSAQQNNYELTVQQKAQNKALRDSLAAATQVLAYHPDSIDLRLKKAAWNIRLEQWQYAKDDLDKVLFLNNTNIAGLFYRAYVNEQLKRFNFARLDYQNLLVLVPGNYQAQLGLALLNEKDKHFTEAYDGLNNLIEQYPDSATAYAARGGVEKEHQQWELAEYDFAKAISLDTANLDYRINHVDVLISLNRKSEAYIELKTLQQLGVKVGELHDFYVRLKKKKYEKR